MTQGNLVRFKRLHLAWRESIRDIDDIEPLRKRMEERADRLAKQNDRAFARLSNPQKKMVRKWLPKLVPLSRNCPGQVNLHQRVLEDRK